MRKRALRCSGLALALLLPCLTLPARALACVVGTGTGASCTEAALTACLPGGGSFDGTVTFNCGGAATITVTSTQTISADTTIDGGSLITISGGNSVGVFSVDAGVSFTVQNLAIANGNSAIYGGGIVSYGTVTVTNSTFSGNSAITSGGGIANRGTLRVTNTTFSGNSASGGGGNGGGIGSDGTVTVTNSTFSGNSAAGSGGGIASEGTVTVTNSTFSGNSASGLVGGAIVNDGTLTVTNSTFSGNSAAGGGGAIFNYDLGTVTVTVTNTIVANSTSGSNCAGTVTDGGHNIDDGTTCGFTGTGCTVTTGTSFCNTNPVLDPTGLQNNGGPTETIELEAGSPAVNAGDESVCAAPPVNNLDQRGYVRPGVGSTNCSIGAYEYNSPGPPCVGDCNGDGTVTVDDILTMVNIALGNTSVTTCEAGDANHDGEITVDEILEAVNNALDGCGAHRPTPRPTSSPTVTAVATPMISPTIPPTGTATATPTATPTSLATTPTSLATATLCSCAPPAQCQQAGTCNGDGTCFYLPVPDGTACTNGGTICVAGSCTQPPLASLTVSPLTLRPAFSPSIYDYAVVCSTGTNTLTLGMTATPGGAVSLSAPVSTAWAPSASVPVSLTEDQAAVVFAQDATGFTQQYWIRCLPPDFPLVAPSTYPEVGSPTPGWYLIGNLFVAAGSGAFAMIVDANGTPIWYHRMASDQGNAAMVTPLPDSTVGITTTGYPSIGTLYFLKTWTTQAINTVGIPLDEHELLLLPNGDFMLLSDPTLTGVDLTGLDDYGPNSAILDCAVQEVDPQGNLVWDWRASNHTDPAKESVVPAGAGTEADPADVYHCNSIDVNANGDVLISSRHMNAVLLVSKTTGNVVWKLSGTPYNKDGAQILTIQGDPEGAFYVQHDARFQPKGDISVFDDHYSAVAAVPGVARGVEYALDLGAGTAHVVWQYQGAASTYLMGSFRRYADGTNLIGWGWYTGPANLAFTEVDAAGHDLLDMLFVSPGNWSYRAEKVPIGSFDIDVLRETAGLS